MNFTRPKYRIRKIRERYIIEIMAYKKKGYLWWKHKEWSWYRTNAWGGLHQVWPIDQPLSKIYKKLSKAE